MNLLDNHIENLLHILWLFSDFKFELSAVFDSSSFLIYYGPLKDLTKRELVWKAKVILLSLTQYLRESARETH